MRPYDLAGPLFTDLYEITMAAAYHDHGMHAEATFSLFIRGRDLPRGYLVCAGIEEALDELAALRFSPEDLAYLKSLDQFSDDFLGYLENFRFSGSVVAMPEGTVFFPGEPEIEVTAPIIESQIVETFLLNTIGLQTMIASKAARCVHVAGGRPLIDFSLRRTQGRDAGLKVARSTYLAGFSATSNVLAGKTYGIPVSGTMAHSYVMSFEREEDAFAAYARTFPDASVFVIDTYDSLEGARKAAKVAHDMKARGSSLVGVRLDSGDIADISRGVRRILDDAGLPEVKIFASGGLDEFAIAELTARDARIDAFGVGTNVGVSADAPFVDIVYKMVCYKNRNVRKDSPGKQTLSGEKQVFRKIDSEGFYTEDIIGTRYESVTDAVPLLKPLMKDGQKLLPHLTPDQVRQQITKNLASLDDACKSLENPKTYPIKISSELQSIQ